MSATITSRPRRVKASDQPLTVVLTITIRATSYAVTRIDPGPDNTRAFRLEKIGGKGEIYDVARTHEGLVVCDCPSYVSTHEGTVSTCKHGSALVLVGLLDAPRVSPIRVETPTPGRIADEFDEPCMDESSPFAPTFDRDWHRSQSAVAEGRALWVEHRHLFATEPLPTAPATPSCCPVDESSPCASCITPTPAEEPVDEPLDGVPDEPFVADESFVAWITRQAEAYDQMRTPRAVWLAGQIQKLADLARHLDATGPGEFQDRAAAMVPDDADHFDADADAWRDGGEDTYSW